MQKDKMRISPLLFTFLGVLPLTAMEHDYRWSDVHHAEEAFMYGKTISLLSDYIRTHRGDFYRLCEKSADEIIEHLYAEEDYKKDETPFEKLLPKIPALPLKGGLLDINETIKKDLHKDLLQKLALREKHGRCLRCGEHRHITPFYNRHLCRVCVLTHVVLTTSISLEDAPRLHYPFFLKKASIEATTALCRLIWRSHCPKCHFSYDERHCYHCCSLCQKINRDDSCILDILDYDVRKPS